MRTQTRAAWIAAAAVASVLAASTAPPSAAARVQIGVIPYEVPTAADFRQMAAAGADSARLAVYWGSVEATQGPPDWRLYDRLVGDMAAAGLTPFANLFGSPAWISSHQAYPPIFTAFEQQGWQRFVTSFAQRYGRSGAFWREHPELPYRPITDWEVWNEANLIGYWDGRPSPRSYAKLLRLTAQALRATDPAAKVIVSGLFPHPPRGFGPTMARFIRGLYRVRGIKKDFDAIAIHPFSPRPAGVLRIMLEAKRAIAKHRDKARMWVTEVGWATSGAGLAGSRLGASESGQAKRLRQSFRLLLKNRKRLRLDGILWHIWRDVDGPGEEPWTQRMGLLRSDGTAKPAFGAFSAFARG